MLENCCTLQKDLKYALYDLSRILTTQNSQVSKSTPKQARCILDEVKKINLLALVNESSRVLIFSDKKGAKIRKKVHFRLQARGGSIRFLGTGKISQLEERGFNSIR